MVAQVRQGPAYDRLLVVLVGDFVDVLRGVGIDLAALSHHGAVALRVTAVELRLEAVEHLLKILCHRDIALSLFEAHELEVHRGVLGTTAVHRHREHLHLHYLFEPLFVELLVRGHVDAHDQRAGVLALKPEHALAGSTHLQTEVIEVHFVVHFLRTYGHALQAVQLLWVRGPDTEMCRHEDLSHYLVLVGHLRVVAEHHAVRAHIGLHPVYARYLLHPGLEGHGGAVALHRLEAFDLHGLELHPFLDSKSLVDGRQLEPAAYHRSEHCKGHREHRRQVLAGLGPSLRTDPYPEGLARAGGDALPAEHAIHGGQPLAFRRHIDVIWTGLLAGHAVAAAPVLVHDHRERLNLGGIGNDFEHIAHHAEGSQIPRPGNTYAQQREHPEEQAHGQQRNPELEAV